MPEPVTIFAQVGNAKTNLRTYKNYVNLERSPKAASATALNKLIEDGHNCCGCAHVLEIFRLLPYK